MFNRDDEQEQNKKEDKKSVDISKKLKKFKKIKIYIIIAIIAFILLILLAVMIAVIPGAMNGIQGVGENTDSPVNQGSHVDAGSLSLFCENCTDEDGEAAGVKASDYYKKMSEMINLYNNLEYETERMDEFDYPLVVATVEYGKMFTSDLYKKVDKLGNIYEQNNLTNKDAEAFPMKVELEEGDFVNYYKWISLMLGTPYSLPNINLRGLTGSLVTGKVVTTCESGNDIKTIDEQNNELIDSIINLEKKFAGKNLSTGFWDSFLSFLGVSSSIEDDALRSKLKTMFAELNNSSGTYKDLEYFISLDYYNPEMACPSGQQRKHTYTKFMNYEQYKVYLETVFIPQNFINCDECVYKDNDERNKRIKIQQIEDEIFAKAKYFREYADLPRIDYDNVMYGTSLSNKDLANFSSSLKESCNVTSPYSELRGMFPHKAIDVNVNGADNGIYAVAAGTVESINIFTTEKLDYDSVAGTCHYNNGNSNPGVQIRIRHEIGGKVFISSYSHLQAGSITLKKGDAVLKGDRIATMGTTGCSTGVHLHFELYEVVDNKQVVLNPTEIFAACNGSGISGTLKIKTTDNYVNPEKCSIKIKKDGEDYNYSLDELVTSMVIHELDDVIGTYTPAVVKALAVAMRTKLMYDTNWCSNGITGRTDLNLNNINDLMIYNLVVETQGMVLNYSGEIINSIYSDFPCTAIGENSWNYTAESRQATIDKLDLSDDATTEEIQSAVNSYNKKCTYLYNGSTGFSSISMETAPLHNQRTHMFSTAMLQDREYNGSKVGMSILIADYYATSYPYTYTFSRLLYEFYDAKGIDEFDIHSTSNGKLDLSTAPGLLDKRKTKFEQNSQGFTYGETLPGSNEYCTGNMSDSEVEKINKEIKDYIDAAEQNAIEKGDINPKRARVLAAAYWKVNNPYCRITYEYGVGPYHYKHLGWNKRWSTTFGYECSAFVIWSFINAGSEIGIKLQNYAYRITQDEPDVRWTVDYILSIPGIKIGDVLNKRYPRDEFGNHLGNGHWGILFEINYEEKYILVADNTGGGPRIIRYDSGSSTPYNRIFNVDDFYQEASWKASKG